jgi:hypothetical protein
MFDDELLHAFVFGFFGYGSFSAPYWFVGMEEGGGNTPEDIALRLRAWETRGKRALEDVVDYHLAIGVSKHFDELGVLQPTWNKLIRIQLAAMGESPTTERVRAFQRTEWGKLSGISCLPELLPLPSPGVDRWLHFTEHSRLPYLASRAAYTEHVRPARVAQLAASVAEYQPKAVVFYGLQYLPSWEAIAGTELRATSVPGTRAFARDGTLYLATRHPAATGMSNAYFHSVGLMIREALGEA